MAYLLIAMMTLLAACTVIHVGLNPGEEGADPPAVNIQTSNSTSVLGSQNVAKDDKAGKGDLNSNKGETSQKAEAKPTTVIAPTIPLP